ncbi:MAG: histidine triad nucleotide-binding protein [Candidatus Omnitrophota bacterium]|jgi:histidine triad (HIT) family protein|nr:MAG: histidine triad nucleotide-binding protein [Candidatus Omnitrophota bacterium]
MSEHDTRDCIFCKIVKREVPTPLEYEDDHVVAFKDINPQAPVHFLVIPKKHIPKIGDLTEEDRGLLDQMTSAAKHLAQKLGIDETGYRLVINSGDNGGQTVYHLHVHVLGGRFMRWPPG